MTTESVFVVPVYVNYIYTVTPLRLTTNEMAA